MTGLPIHGRGLGVDLHQGINGFGRIGRSIFRASSKDEAFADIEIVGANGDEAQANPDQPQIVPDAQ